MNFLAHIYLSGPKELIKIGNFAADGIRGMQYTNYPMEMQIGILLHRKIDSYTDAHATFKNSCRRLYKNYSHYSRVIVDIFYDHYLAANWSDYSEIPLSVFVKDFYQLVEDHMTILPPKFQHIIPHMISGNWLEGYASFKGIDSVLKGMDRRTRMQSKMSLAVEDLKANYTAFEEDFRIIFADLINYSKEQRIQLEDHYLS